MEIHSKQDLVNSSCQSLDEEYIQLDDADISQLLNYLEGWVISDNHQYINKTYHFKNYFQTIAFVNATAWICHKEDHHPDLKVTYNSCKVTFTTHSVNTLSIKDFICAAKFDSLFN